MKSRNRSPPKRRLTPADNPSVLTRWKTLEDQYLEAGYSRRSAHEKIADEYGCNRTTCFRWLTYGSNTPPRSKLWSYEEQTKRPSFLPQRAFQKRFYRDPARYLASLLQPDENISLEDLSLRLQTTYSYQPRLPTLERLLTAPNPKTGRPILEKCSDDPALYRPGQTS